MEEIWLVKRQALRELLRENRHRPYQELVEATGGSLAWVKKWVPRLRQDLNDDPLLQRRCRHPESPACPCRTTQVVERILEIRDYPPEGLRRTPGPRTILYYLHQDAGLRAAQLRLPRSTRTIWQVLVVHQRIVTTPL